MSIAVEYAPTGKSTCKGCRVMLDKGELRVRQGGSRYVKMFHLGCWSPGPNTFEMNVRNAAKVKKKDMDFFLEHSDGWDRACAANCTRRDTKKRKAEASKKKTEARKAKQRKARVLARMEEEPEAPDGECPFQHLSHDLWSNICSSLGVDDMTALCCTDKKTNEILSNQDDLFQYACAQRLKISRFSDTFLPTITEQFGGFHGYAVHLRRDQACVGCATFEGSPPISYSKGEMGVKRTYMWRQPYKIFKFTYWKPPTHICNRCLYGKSHPLDLVNRNDLYTQCREQLKNKADDPARNWPNTYQAIQMQVSAITRRAAHCKGYFVRSTLNSIEHLEDAGSGAGDSVEEQPVKRRRRSTRLKAPAHD